jgi:S1-C subfamily serine protease
VLRGGAGCVLATLACLFLPSLLTAEVAEASSRQSRSPADALAFVRVIADVRVDYGGVREPVEQKGVELATGSGFVASPSGLVLTSQHVVAEPDPGDPIAPWDGGRVQVENRRIEVVIGGAGERRVFDAWVAAADPEVDLAALQVTAADLPYLPMGDSDAVEPSRPVQVLGFPFGRQVEVARGGAAMPDVTVTVGSLSAAREDAEGGRRFLQTDASVNPGSSGGPMVDEDGYVVGLVRMKLSKGPTGAGPGFAVPVDLVKDFLEANGLLAQLPVGRLRPGVVQAYDWKKVNLEVPDGFRDSASTRVRLDLGEIEGIDARVFRLPAALPPEELTPALLRRGEVPGFVPAPAGARGLGRTRGPSGARVRLGSVGGETSDHRPFRVEYAVLALKGEAVVARYLGDPDAIAFNLGLVRRSLRSLDAAPLRGAPPPVPRAPGWRGHGGGGGRAAFPTGEAAGVPVPADWAVEPAEDADWPSCLGSTPAGTGVAARSPADYAVVLRAWRLPAPAAADPEQALAVCGTFRRYERLGIVYDVGDRVVRRPGDTLLLELEGPSAARLPLEGVLDRWAEAVAASSR